MSGDSGETVWADTDEIFSAAAKLRRINPAANELSITSPETGGFAADAILGTVASGCGALPTNLGANLEVIAKAITVCAIDVCRADEAHE